jgi:hypothetical protein
MKWMLLLWLALQPWLALADWEAVDENFLAVVYIDPDKIRASSVYPQAWHLIDLRERAKTGAMSRLALMEYDCHDQRRRTLAFASKSEAMGEGKTLFTSAVSTPWKPVTMTTRPAAKSLRTRTSSIDSMRALVNALLVLMGTCQPA